MNVPDKHKQLAYAWVDGADIQFKGILGEWIDMEKPNFHEMYEYRIKPKRVRFYEDHDGAIRIVLNESEVLWFKKWLTDWVDYVG